MGSTRYGAVKLSASAVALLSLLSPAAAVAGTHHPKKAHAAQLVRPNPISCYRAGNGT